MEDNFMTSGLKFSLGTSDECSIGHRPCARRNTRASTNRFAGYVTSRDGWCTWPGSSRSNSILDRLVRNWQRPKFFQICTQGLLVFSADSAMFDEGAGLQFGYCLA